jgi:diacylglycerol kinase family enzyme
MQRDLCIIVNAAAGRGRAARLLPGLRQALADRAEFRPSTEAGHAEELARAAAAEGFPLVGAAGGDGTVHEVANGILRAGCPETALGVFPTGSANDYAHSLGLVPGWWLNPKPDLILRWVDVGVVRSSSGRQRHFVNGLGLGFNGAVTLESRRIRWLRGVPLYGLALLRALWRHFKHPQLQLAFDGQQREVPTLALTVALGRREGNFVLAPDALLDDGLFDYLHAGPISRWELLRHAPGMITGRLPRDHPRLWMGRCRRVTVVSQTPLRVHTDGEFFCQPEDGVTDLEVELLPGRLRVQAARLSALG